VGGLRKRQEVEILIKKHEKGDRKRKKTLTGGKHEKGKDLKKRGERARPQIFQRKKPIKGPK